jgi:hypothetical protein
MKKLLLLLVAAISMVTVVPSAHAFDKDNWRGVEKTLHQLYARMDTVKADRDRFGAGPRMRDQFAQLHYGIEDLTARVQGHAGDPTVARKKADNLSDVMSQVESEYHAIAHHQREGIVIHIDR